MFVVCCEVVVLIFVVCEKMIDSIVSAIVRPPRARYSIQDIGPINIRHKGVEYHREDFIVSLFLSFLLLFLSLISLAYFSFIYSLFLYLD